MAKWIDFSGYEFETRASGVGAVGYLVETLNTSTAPTSFSLRERPLRTNVSREPRLNGWCGETDNKSRYARGCWRVTRFNAAGDRAQIVQFQGDDLAAFLAEDGYPELLAA